MIQAIFDWMQGLEAKDVDEILIEKEVPICIFNSPPGESAKTVFEQSTTTGASAGWSIEILGTGGGSDVSFSVSQTATFTAVDGERKLIFMPTTIRATKVALYKRGKFQSHFYRHEVAESDVRHANGIRTVGPDEWHRLVTGGKPIERFDLSGDSGTQVASYERAFELEGTLETKVGFKAFDVESAVTAKLSSTEKVSLSFDLPPGRRYELREAVGMAGFYFD